MDLRLLIAISGLVTFAAFFLAGYAFLMKKPTVDRRIRDFEHKKQSRVSRFVNYLRRSEEFLKPLGEMIPRSPEEMSRQEKRLVQAGIRRRDGPALFTGTKVALAIAVFLVFSFTGYLQENLLLFTILSVFLGALLPDLWLTQTIARRKQRLQIALPDALDLAVVCVEAGLGLDQSLLRIGLEFSTVHPDLSEELNLYSLEVNAGRKRADAFRNMGDRTGVDDIRSFVAVLIQTDRFGTSIAQSLRVFADGMRTKRRQRAEEHAAKMNIKMIPPLVFFVFPAIFVVVLGPALIRIIRFLDTGSF